MWTLIGIESGTIFATRAKKLSDVAKVTTIDSIIVILLLIGTSILSLGLLSPTQITKLHQPSMEGLMEVIFDKWGAYLINICLIVVGIYSAGYDVLLKFSTSLSIVPYLLVSLYALKSVILEIGFENRSKGERIRSGISALIATLFALFMIYGAGS